MTVIIDWRQAWEEARARVKFLEDELRAAQHSVFRKRKEIRQQKRQIEGWKEENPKAARRVKELENLRGKLARVRFNGENAEHERDTALEDLAAVEAERDEARRKALIDVAEAFETRPANEAMRCSEVALYCREQAAEERG